MIEVLYGGAATRLALDAEYEDDDGAEQRRRHAAVWLFPSSSSECTRSAADA